MIDVEVTVEATKLTFFAVLFIWANLNGRIIADDFYLIHKKNPIQTKDEDLHNYYKFDECEI